MAADGVECTVWLTLLARMRIKPSVVATIVFGMKRTSEYSDVQRVLVKFSDAHDWSTELNQQS